MGSGDPTTLGEYFATWTSRYPRSERTNATNKHRIGRVLEVDIEGTPLAEWPLRDLRRRHTAALVDHMLRVQGRATTGVVGILRSLSALAEDAITDEVAEVNPFKGLRVRANDPRARRRPREIRVFGFEEMHRFAAAAGRHEAMVRIFTDTGMRLGEVLPLRCEDFDGKTLAVRRTAHEGTILPGTKTDHGEAGAGRVVPCPPTLARMIEASLRARGGGGELLFPTPTGRLAPAQLLPRCLAPDPGTLGNRHPPPRMPSLLHSRTCGRQASTTPTWPRSSATGWKRCWLDTPTRSGPASRRSER
jgi:integrase